MAKLFAPLTEHLFNRIFLSQKVIRADVKQIIKVPVAKFNLIPSNAYVEHNLFIKDVENAVLDPLCGIRVLWAPPGYGKTTYARAVCNQLQLQKKISGAIVQNAAEGARPNPTLTAWLASSMGAPKAQAAPWFTHISDILPDELDKPVAIVIDQFDHLIGADKLQSFVVSMAEDSLRTKKYVVLLPVTDLEFAAKILSWNGGQKISLVGQNLLSYKWNEAHFDGLWKAIASNIEIPELAKKQFMSTCAIAGTPGYFLKYYKQANLNSDFANMNVKAREVHDKWQYGHNRLLSI